MFVHREGASRVCLFSSYFVSDRIPFYVKFYLQELRRFFDQVVMLTNDNRKIDGNDVDWLKEQGIDLMMVPNEGYDFGMWQKTLPLLELDSLERLALVNDSCILFAPLDDYFQWLDQASLDVAGMTESFEKGRHLQSYFLVFQRQAIISAAQYILAHPVSGLGYQDVVATFELGLSRLLYGSGAFRVMPRFRVDGGCRSGNPSYLYVSMLIENGFPLIKKRVVAKESVGIGMKRIIQEGRNPFPEYYISLAAKRNGLAKELVNSLFSEALLSGRGNWPKFWRRYLRYRLMVSLGVLQRLPVGASIVMGN